MRYVDVSISVLRQGEQVSFQNRIRQTSWKQTHSMTFLSNPPLYILFDPLAPQHTSKAGALEGWKTLIVDGSAEDVFV